MQSIAMPCFVDLFEQTFSIEMLADHDHDNDDDSAGGSVGAGGRQKQYYHLTKTANEYFFAGANLAVHSHSILVAQCFPLIHNVCCIGTSELSLGRHHYQRLLTSVLCSSCFDCLRFAFFKAPTQNDKSSISVAASRGAVRLILVINWCVIRTWTVRRRHWQMRRTSRKMTNENHTIKADMRLIFILCKIFTSLLYYFFKSTVPFEEFHAVFCQNLLQVNNRSLLSIWLSPFLFLFLLFTVCFCKTCTYWAEPPFFEH